MTKKLKRQEAERMQELERKKKAALEWYAQTHRTSLAEVKLQLSGKKA